MTHRRATQTRIHRSLAGAFALALATACSTPMPTEQLAVAANAIDHAERAGAAQYASADLAKAQDKLQRARSGADSRTLTPAQVAYLAQEAEADAKLADAQTQAGKAKAAVDATQQDLQAIQEEARRAAEAPVVPAP